MLSEYELKHNDIARYTINMECLKNDIKRVLKNADADDIFKRLMGMNIPMSVECPTEFFMPQPLMDLMNSTLVYKVEWYKDGVLVVKPSDAYSSNILSHQEVFNISRKHAIPMRLIDTINCADWTVAYQLWVETIENTGMAMKYNTPVFWRDENKVCSTTITMMSILITTTSIVTVTSLSKALMYKF